MNRSTIQSVIRSLRQVNLQGSAFGQTVAIRFGLSESDVEALELLIESGASTAGRLSELTGLTTGAITRVIDRLEQAGYVRRVSDPVDRRRVIVEVVPDRVASFAATIGRVDDRGASEIARYTDAELALINDFLTTMAEITRAEATALRETAETPADRPAEHSAPLGGLDRGRLLVRSGSNALTIRGDPDLGQLYRVTSEGAVPTVRLRDGVVTIQFKGRSMPWQWRNRNLDVALNATIPWAIEMQGGARQIAADLAALDVRRLDLHGGAERMRVNLGRPNGSVKVGVLGGVSQLRVDRPAGVPIRLQLSGGAGRVDFDRQRLQAVGGSTVLQSEGAEGATDRFVVELTGGASRIAIGEAGPPPGSSERRGEGAAGPSRHAPDA